MWAPKDNFEESVNRPEGIVTAPAGQELIFHAIRSLNSGNENLNDEQQKALAMGGSLDGIVDYGLFFCHWGKCLAKP